MLTIKKNYSKSWSTCTYVVYFKSKKELNYDRFVETNILGAARLVHSDLRIYRISFFVLDIAVTLTTLEYFYQWQIQIPPPPVQGPKSKKDHISAEIWSKMRQFLDQPLFVDSYIFIDDVKSVRLMCH